jgi:hypothetical protein
MAGVGDERTNLIRDTHGGIELQSARASADLDPGGPRRCRRLSSSATATRSTRPDDAAAYPSWHTLPPRSR